MAVLVRVVAGFAPVWAADSGPFFMDSQRNTVGRERKLRIFFLLADASSILIQALSVILTGVVCIDRPQVPTPKEVNRARVPAHG